MRLFTHPLELVYYLMPFFSRPDTLDPALMRPGRLDRRVEFSLPDLEGRSSIFKIHARSMSVERDIRFELLARLCPNSTGQFDFQSF
jgi:26S proteasome regulatory subunit T1